MDDNDDQYETSYTFDTSSLSGPGWRDFSTSHALMEQDYLVFELVDDCKFKVCFHLLFLELHELKSNSLFFLSQRCIL